MKPLFCSLFCVLLLTGCQTTGSSSGSSDFLKTSRQVLAQLPIPVFGAAQTDDGLAHSDISAAFRQALSIGTEDVVTQLSAENGFYSDSKIHIPLPPKMAKAQSVLKQAGLSGTLDDLETRLNRAAEIATPHARELFINAISQMTFDDIMAIYNGPKDSATRYFRQAMAQPLAAKMTPFVNDAVNQAGAIQSYNQVMARYQAIPFMPDIQSDLTQYVVNEGIEGIFFYLAQQEQQIRENPARHTTDLLKKVFGQQ